MQPFQEKPPHRTLAREESDRSRFQKEGCLRQRRLRQRALVLQAIRSWFANEGFLEVDTPAVAMSPGLELHLAAIPVVMKVEPDRYERRYLITSPEYFMKRLLSAGFDKIFQIGKVWRDGDIGALHFPEFTMLEWYRAAEPYERCMDDTEALIRAAALALKGTTIIQYAGNSIDLQPRWPRLPFCEAMRRVTGLDPLELDTSEVFRSAAQEHGYYLSPGGDWSDLVLQIFVTAVEPDLGRMQPVFITEYPAAMASLARLKPDDPRVSERFELYAGGLELCNGFGELVDAEEQQQRFSADQQERRRRGLPSYPVDERFLNALRDGCPQATGNALGIDRLVMLLSEARNIEEVVAFPLERA